MQTGIVRRIVAVLLCAALLAMSLSCTFAVSAEGTRSGSKNYYSNQSGLEEESFITLPLGAVTPSGWLKDQLTLQKNGITSAMEDYDNYGPNSGWLGGTGENWEKGPYYVRGLVALAYTLQDAELISRAQKWIDWSINSQRSDGFFGPANNTDWWPRMPMLMAIRDYYEATENLGTPDERVLPFLEKYFRYQLKALPQNPLSSWAIARGGDNVEVVLWLYNRLYSSAAPEDSAWLLELAELLLSQTTNWTNTFTNTTAREHVVNTAQGLKTPVMRYLLSGKAADKNAFETGLLNISIDHGRIDDLPNADEGASDNKPTRGTELCGIVESMLSTEIALNALGEVSIADRLERLAYNSLPAAYAPDYLGASYFISQNQVLATAGNHEFSTDHGDDLTFGAPCGFECCFPNNHMGWPKYVQNMWKSTSDNGLAAVAYGPNRVEARVADGKTAVFTQDTDYPFDEAIVLNYEGETADFPLLLRVPSWCEAPEISVNGVAQTGAVSGEFFTLNHTWTAGDRVEIRFPMEIKTSSWLNSAVAVERGPLIYSLKIEGEWVENTDPEIRQMNVATKGGLLAREVYPTSRWNYGLIVNKDDPAASFEVVQSEVTTQPFDTGTAPVVLKAKGQILPDWQLDGNLVGQVPYGEIAYDESMVEDIELVPFACTKLRITQFPRIAVEGDSSILTFGDKTETVRDGIRTQEFKNITVPKAEEYFLTIRYKGSGRLRFLLNGREITAQTFSDSGEVTRISDLKGMISNSSLQFNENHINNIRFVGNDDVEVLSVTVTPISALNKISVSSVKAGSGSFSVTGNIDRQTAQYAIRYGTESGKYTMTASGFHGSTATVTGLQSGTYYFVLEATLDGKTVVSEEQQVTVEAVGTSGSENVIAPEAPITDDFSDATASDALWQKIGATAKINVTDGKLRVGEDGDVKAILKNGESWNDYTVEAKIQLTQYKEFNNAGIIFRTTNAKSGPDAYNGYYFGITQSKAMVGYADGGWHSIRDIECGLSYGKEYTLKVIVAGSRMAFFVENKMVYCMNDTRFSAGTVGVRSYEESFTADDFTVRAMTADDQSQLDKAFSGAEFQISGRRYSGLVQVRYENLTAAASYKVMYGTEPGVYTNEVYDHYYNSFTGGAAGTTAISVPDDTATYYVRVVALNGDTQIGVSEELVFAPFRLAAPEGLEGISASSPEASDGRITGVTSAMEYRAEGEEAYIPCPDGELTGLRPGVYYVRYAATETSRASADTAIEISGERPILPGDVNGDEAVTVSDVVALRQLIVRGTWSGRELAAGNLDGTDDLLTVSDVVALRALIVAG